MAASRKPEDPTANAAPKIDRNSAYALLRARQLNSANANGGTLRSDPGLGGSFLELDKLIHKEDLDWPDVVKDVEDRWQRGRILDEEIKKIPRQMVEELMPGVEREIDRLRRQVRESEPKAYPLLKARQLIQAGIDERYAGSDRIDQSPTWPSVLKGAEGKEAKLAILEEEIGKIPPGLVDHLKYRVGEEVVRLKEAVRHTSSAYGQLTDTQGWDARNTGRRPAAAPLPVPFSAPFEGSWNRTEPDRSGLATLTIAGPFSVGPVPLHADLFIKLTGEATANGTVANINGGEVRMGPVADPDQWSGDIVGKKGNAWMADLSDDEGGSYTAKISFRLAKDRKASGIIEVTE
jgi:hypothetical protein